MSLPPSDDNTDADEITSGASADEPDPAPAPDASDSAGEEPPPVNATDDPSEPDSPPPKDPPDESDPEPTNVPRPDLSTLRLRMFNVTCFFYVIMGVIGFFWMRFQNVLIERLTLSPRIAAVPDSLLYGATTAVIVVVGGTLVQRFTDWADAFEKEFAPLMNVFSYAQVPVVAFVSAAGEELLFRGALQTSIDLIPAALLFGLVHFPWNRVMLPWPFFAAAIGLVFGYITQVTGSLYGPILGHFLINLVNITLIKSRHPMNKDELLDELIP